MKCWGDLLRIKEFELKKPVYIYSIIKTKQ